MEAEDWDCVYNLINSRLW